MTAIEMVYPIAQEFVFSIYRAIIGDNQIDVVVEMGARRFEKLVTEAACRHRGNKNVFASPSTLRQ